MRTGPKLTLSLYRAKPTQTMQSTQPRPADKLWEVINTKGWMQQNACKLPLSIVNLNEHVQLCQRTVVFEIIVVCERVPWSRLHITIRPQHHKRNMSIRVRWCFDFEPLTFPGSLWSHSSPSRQRFSFSRHGHHHPEASFSCDTLLQYWGEKKEGAINYVH